MTENNARPKKKEKMLLSASINSGTGLTAGNKLCGKAISENDDTYLTTVNLREKFIQLKKFLTVKQTPNPKDNEVIESLRDTVAELHDELTQQKTITDAATKKNTKVSEDLEELKKQLQDTELVPDLIKKVLTPEILTKLQYDYLQRIRRLPKPQDKAMKIPTD